MVRDGKELSTDLKETIMGLDQEGYSACKIAEFLSLNRRTVSYIIKRYRERGTVENLPRSGRKRDNHIPTLPWPPQSPDLNIIENVWRTLKIQLKRRVNDIKTKQDLKDAVQDIWYKLPLHYIYRVYFKVFQPD